MVENNEGKKPIKIVNNVEEAKKPVKIIKEEKTLENKNSGFQKETKKSKKFYLILGLVACAIIAFIIINNIPKDIETVKDSVVMIRVYDKQNNEISTGSGFCAYKSNYIITNYHVIEGAYKIKIVDDEGKQYNISKIEIFNKNDDLAILKGEFELTPLKIGSVSNLKAGENITAIGSPKGQLNTVSKGIVSNADNDYEIRITAPISPRK